MNFLHKSVLVAIAIGLALSPQRMRALPQPEAEKGRALVKQYADTIVSIELVVTIRISVNDKALPPQESKVDVNGTVISPTGLTVSALSIIDPHGAMEAMRAARANSGQKVEIGETEFKDVKLRLANGSEIPAAVVLKDPDLNLIFIAPLPADSGPARNFSYVSLDKEASASILEDYFYVSRAPKNLQRVPVVHSLYIAGIVEKPRRMFLLSEPAVGAPIFDSSGLLLGICTQYLDNGRPAGPVVLTPSDVAELAKQAAAIKPEEKVASASNSEPAPQKAKAPEAGAVPPAPAAGTPPAGPTPAKP
jgi:hypothetical protein